MKLGVGLWTMRSTALYPAAWPRLYSQLREDAQLTEALGFHSLWIAEHHFWYDGWVPAPLVAAASALAATSSLHVGTGIHLLPLREPDPVVSQVCELHRLAGGRLEHGVGLGYRASEYDGYGISRTYRGKRMDAALELLAVLGSEAPPTWVGGFAPAAIHRAARLGLGTMLPSTLTIDRLRATIDSAREAAEQAGRSNIRVGVMKYAWPTDGSARERDWAIARLDEFTREYSGAWFALRGSPGFEAPDLLDAQIRRSADTALIGAPDELLTGLADLADAGVELCVLHLIGDARLPRFHDALERIASRVLPTYPTVTVA